MFFKEMTGWYWYELRRRLLDTELIMFFSWHKAVLHIGQGIKLLCPAMGKTKFLPRSDWEVDWVLLQRLNFQKLATGSIWGPPKQHQKTHQKTSKNNLKNPGLRKITPRIFQFAHGNPHGQPTCHKCHTVPPSLQSSKESSLRIFLWHPPAINAQHPRSCQRASKTHPARNYEHLPATNRSIIGVAV